MILFGVTSVVEAQKTVTGTVTDTKGEPLYGVTIRESEAKNTAVTDLNGHFQIQVSTDAAILQFRYMGMEPYKASVKGKASLSVKMKEETTTLLHLPSSIFHHPFYILHLTSSIFHLPSLQDRHLSLIVPYAVGQWLWVHPAGNIHITDGLLTYLLICINLSPIVCSILAIVEVVKLCLPVSHFDTSESRLPSLQASSCCVIPFFFKTASNLSAIPYDKSNSALCSRGMAERHCLNSSFVTIAYMFKS